jgi:hypothetical protein
MLQRQQHDTTSLWPSGAKLLLIITFCRLFVVVIPVVKMGQASPPRGLPELPLSFAVGLLCRPVAVFQPEQLLILVNSKKQ